MKAWLLDQAMTVAGTVVAYVVISTVLWMFGTQWTVTFGW